MKHGKRDLHRARLDPASCFDSPEAVLEDPSLGRGGKIEILRRWQYDASELAVAEEEGMPGPEPGLLGRILRALDVLRGRSEGTRNPPTKHGAQVPRGPESSELAEPDEYAEARAAMVELQLESRDIRDPRVLAAMRKIPRHLFVPPRLRDLAYDDGPLPIGHGQTISQPYVVALMSQLAVGARAGKVLDVGTGSGYQAAVLAEMVEEVYSVEVVTDLFEQASERLARLGYRNVRLRMGDGHVGWPEASPFDAIVVACAARRVPEALIEQLAPGGTLVIPVGVLGQELQVIERLEDGTVRRSSAGAVAFVPMVRSRAPESGEAG
jgi:protein-L-isoaspartate(D-aspartate) O-methyltransferase